MKTKKPEYKCKFRHYRNINISGSINSRGGATLAFTDDAKVSGEKFFAGSIAYCNVKDNYNKAYGRAKSHGLLVKHASGNFRHLADCVAATGEPRHFLVEGDDMKRFLAIVDEEMEESGFAPR